MNWNDLAQNKVHWLVLVNAAMNDGDALNSWRIVSS